MFKKILIANRGEIAVRIIRSCRELGIPTVAVYSLADRDCLHVEMADEAVCIGPPPNKDSYLNIPNIMQAALNTGADAIHPGYGNLSEVAAFAENCDACGIKFIGPRAETIRKMQDKAAARSVVRASGVPVVPGSDAPVESEQEALRTASQLAYPVLIKAAMGGGGRGIRVCHNDDDLTRNLRLAQSEAQAAFGRGDVYLEKYLEEPRHVEFQILADEHGNILHLGERECSIQTAKHQKLLEESPCSGLGRRLRHHIGEAAIRTAKAVGYTNAGTVEFMVDKSGRFYFMEMNTRIQVEHPVTEMVTGRDLVREQIRIAYGHKLGLHQRDITFNGHAIECRITAEDHKNHFLASSGVVKSLRLPGGTGVRVDTHLYPGYTIPPFYDALLAKLVVWAPTRPEAIARARRALEESQIDGLKTTIPFHVEVMANAYFRRGEVATNFLLRRMGLT
ncbi:MAG TPA: acetyl-CoA carboxylase biotin carboxylase subunit [Armatimonadota bacterium]|nr:acetyl-CoA carboxylase biotin carboxylase subunit [Armatimonadota bacterium]